MSVVPCHPTLCKNIVLFFEKIEWINLFFILDQTCVFYCNPVISYSNDLVLSHACSQPCKTPKSRSMHFLEHFWSMKWCHLLPVQNCSFAKLALASFSFLQTNFTTLSYIHRDTDLEILATPRTTKVPLAFCQTPWVHSQIWHDFKFT